MKKLLFVLLGLLVLSAAGCSQKNAENNDDESDFPNKSIEIIIPFSAGGSSDTVARSLEQALNENLPGDDKVVLNNNDGSAGTIGTTEVANAEPDGYKILFASEAPITVQPHYGDTSYTYKDLQAVSMIQDLPLVLYVKSDSEYQNFKEWKEYITNNPGDFTFAIAGSGSISDIAIEQLLKSMNDVDVKKVPFDGGGPAVNAVLGGHADGAVLAPSDVQAQVKNGDLIPILNLSTNTDIDGLEDVVVAKEEDLDVDLTVSVGIYAPKELPEGKLEILTKAFEKTLEDPKVVSSFEKFGYKPTYAGPDELQEHTKEKSESNKEVMKQMGLID